MDAVFVANDQMALSVLQHACRNNISVPDDLGIVGFDNIAETAFYWPPLTTVQQDQTHLGKTAVEGIIRIIESDWDGGEPEQPRSLLIEPTLVIRRSALRRKSGEKEVSLPEDE